MSDSGKAVFLSYASQDADAARKIADALRGAAVEVWFDQSELVGGDAWDAKIRKQIAECALFVPVISASTQARREGYFRLEWRLAAQRTHMMSEQVAFVLPVVIDATRDAEADVPAEFRAVQWTRLPGGETSAAFCARVKALLESSAGTLPASEIHGQGARATPNPAGRTPAPLASRRSRWLLPAVAVVLVATIAGLVFFNSKPQTQNSKQTAASTPTSEASRLLAKARQILEDSDELNRENHFLAEDLVKRAVILEPANAQAWALHADISFSIHWHGLDDSEARRDALRSQAERARSLDRESTEAQLAFAYMRILLRQDLPGVERDLVALASRDPGNWRVHHALGYAYRVLNRTDEAIRATQRAHELSRKMPRVSGDLAALYLRRNRFAEAEAVIVEGLAKRTTGRLLAFDLIVKAQCRGDLAAAAAAIAEWPSWFLAEDRGAILAMRTWLWSGQPEKVLLAARRMNRDYLRDWRFIGPRSVFTARAHELAGHSEAAQADWRTVVQVCDRELKTTPGNPQALYWKAWALARLGDIGGAQSLCTQLEQRNLWVTGPTTQGVIDVPQLLVTAGRIDQAVAELRTPVSKYDLMSITRAELELDPAFAPLRADPRYPDLLKSAPTLEGKAVPPKSPKGSAAVVPAIAEKSVAVLAFTNLSADKANEYFSDGITEELLNVLAKVPDLKVTARTSSFHFKGKDLPVPEIARQLGVAYVVEGTVKRDGPRVRITAKLIKAADGFQVWSERFDRELKDVFALQDEIAGLIAKNLSLRLGGNAPAKPVSPEVFQLYLEGLQEWNRRSPAALALAAAAFEKALALDPGFARGHAMLADTRYLLAQTQETVLPGAPDLTRAHEGVERALALDPNLVDAYVTRGILRHLERKYAEADADFQRALTLNPNSALARQRYGTSLCGRGKFPAGLPELELAVRLDPLAPINAAMLAQFLNYARRWEESLAASAKALAIDPDFGRARFQRLLPLIQLGRHDEALVIARRETPYEHNALRLSFLVRAGDRDAARLAEAALARRAEATPRSILQLYLALNRIDDAFAFLEQTRLTAVISGPGFTDPIYDPIRDDPRFLRALEEGKILADYREAWSHIPAAEKTTRQAAPAR